MVQREFQCAPCKVKHKGSQERQDKHQKRKGCFELMGNPVMQYRPNYSMKGSQKILYYKCPALFYSSYCAEFVNQLENYTKGVYMYSGSLSEQPAKFVELMELVNNLMSEHKEELSEKQKQYGKQGRGRGRA